MLLEIGQQWEIWQVAFAVRRVPASGAEYEQAVMPDFTPTLAPEIAAGRPFEVALPGSPTLEIPASAAHGRRSRLDLIRFRLQRGIRVAGLLRRPEAFTEIYGQDPAPARRRRVLREVHVIEATLVTDFSSNHPTVVHKRVQIPATLLNIRSRYGVDARVGYHIISPRRPSRGMILEIERQLRQLSMPNLRIVWRITG